MRRKQFEARTAVLPSTQRPRHWRLKPLAQAIAAAGLLASPLWLLFLLAFNWALWSKHVSGLSELTVPNFKQSKLYLPSLPEQRAIVENLEALSVETQRLESLYQQKLAALDELKKSLLHEAFSGKL